MTKIMEAPSDMQLNPHWPAPKPGRPQVLYDLEETFHAVYDRSLSATDMADRAMRRQRHYLIPQTLRQLADVSGDAVEVGCYRGLSAHLACSTLVSLGQERTFRIFDSFEGLSAAKPEDESKYMPAKFVGVEKLFACSEEEVRKHLAAFPFIEYHKGWVPERFGDVDGKQFCYVHIDVDLYEPTRDCLDFFWPRLSRGGAMIMDDYATAYYPGARRAADEFFAGRGDAFIVATPSGSAAVVKIAA